MKIRTFEIICFLSLLVCIIYSTISFDSQCDDIRQNVLRLHVIANSDSARDQELKCTVRDELLKSGTFAVGTSQNKHQAQKAIENNLSSLQHKAQQKVYDCGFGYDVKVETGKSYFPTKQYDDITLPAGYYDAVKVIIGQGQGQNWWCVMFPCLCIPAATKNEINLEDILEEEQMKIVKKNEKYEVRFWLVEKYYEIFKSENKK